jgi:hypothetical protein
MKISHFLTVFACLSSVSVVGCADAADVDPSAQATSALDGAQCTFKRTRGTEDACFATYGTCLGATGADAAACRTALQDCVPKPLAAPVSAAIGAENSSGKRGGEGGGAEGGGGERGRGGAQTSPTPAAEVLAPCRTALDSCLVALKGDQAACFQNKCVDEGFRAAFVAKCDESLTRCVAPEDADATAACNVLKAKCAEGAGARFAAGAPACP